MPQARAYPDFDSTFKRFAAASEKTFTASPELGTKQPPQITERNENDAGMPASPQDTLGVRNIHFSAISNFHHFNVNPRVGLRTLRYRPRSQPGGHHYSKSTSYFSSKLSHSKKKGMDLTLPISASVSACPQRVQVLSRKYCTQHRILSKICDMTIFKSPTTPSHHCEAESDSAPAEAAPSLMEPCSSAAEALARPQLQPSSHYSVLNGSFRSRMLHSNTASQTSKYPEDKPFFSTGLHGPHLSSLNRRSQSGVGATAVCGRACGFDSDNCARCTDAAVGADFNFDTCVEADTASCQHTATSLEVPVLAEAKPSSSTTTADVPCLEGQEGTADNPAVASMALQWNTVSLCLDSAAKARVHARSDASGNGSSDSSESSSSTCHLSFSSSESDSDNTTRAQGQSSDSESWLVDSGATNHFGEWETEVARGKPQSNYRYSSSTLLGIGGKKMRASAVGHSGPLRNVTFYNGIGSNLISAAKLCSDSNVSIVITKAGMSLIHDDEASKLLQRSAANKLCSTTSNGLYKVRLRRLDEVLYRVKTRHQHRQELANLAAEAKQELEEEKRRKPTFFTAFCLHAASHASWRDFISSPPAQRLQRAHLSQVLRSSGWDWAHNGDTFVSDEQFQAASADKALLASYRPSSEIMLLHQRMGHASLDDMKHAVKNCTHNKPYGCKVSLRSLNALHQFHCRQCPLGKLVKASLPRKTKAQRFASRHPTCLGRVGSDTAGPRTLPSLIYQDRHGHLQGGTKYWQANCDDYSKLIWTADFKHKDDLPHTMRHTEKGMAIDAASCVHAPPPGGTPLRVMCYRTDNAGELTSKDAVRHFHKQLIKRELSVPDCSVQNALAETAILIVQNKARMLLVDARLGIEYTMLAVKYATLLINCGRCVANPEGKSRWEMFYGQPPDTSRLKTFGAECWLHMPVKNRAGKDKQSANGSGGNLKYRFVGIPRGTKGYMIMDTTAKPHPRILVRLSVHFQEDMTYIHDNADSSCSSYTEDSSYTSDSEGSHTSGMPDISTLSYSSGSESDSSSSDSSYISSDSALYCATNSSSSDSDSSSSDGGADQLGANNPLGPNAPQPKAAQQPPPATASSSSSATSGSSSYSGSSDSRGNVVTTLHNDTLRTVAARHDINVVLLQSLNNMDNKPVPLSAKFKTNTELFLPSQLELDAWELARFSRLKGHDSLEGSAKINFTGIWSDSDHNTGSSSAGGQHALDLSDFSSECTSSVKFGAGGLKSQKSTAPHDSEHKSSTDEFPLDDPVENGPPLRRPISHAQGKLNRMAFMAEFVSPSERDENPLLTLEEIEMAQLDYQLEQAALHAGMPADSVQHCDALTEYLDEVFTLAAATAQDANNKHLSTADKRERAKGHKRLAHNLFNMGGERQHAHLVKQLKHLTDVNAVPDPKTIAEALEGDFEEFWREAILAELQQMDDMKVWHWAHLPKGRRAIDTKWVLRVKRNYQGLIDRFKARLVGRGFKGVLGVDYWKTHASVVRKSTLRMVIAHAARHNLAYNPIDIKSAFLEADIDRDVYITVYGPGIPECNPPEPGMVRCLDKSLYGIKQAPRQWMLQMMEDLLKWGFVQHRFDPCLFMLRKSDSDYTLVCLYVDDMSVTFTNSEGNSNAYKSFTDQLMKRYRCSQSDDRDVYLGIRIRRTAPGHYSMDQERYTVTLLKKYAQWANGKPIKTSYNATPSSDARRKKPLSKTDCPTTDKEKEEMLTVPYRQVIGSLRHLEQWTRPDLSTALNILSSFQSNPGKAHWSELKRLLHYVRETRNLAIHYGEHANPNAEKMGHDVSSQLTCFVDADWATDKETRRSRTGYVFYSNNGPVAWRSRLQVTQALSTCEAEFMAASDAACMNAYLRYMLHDIQEIVDCGNLKQMGPTNCWSQLCQEDFDPLQLPRTFSSRELPVNLTRLRVPLPPTVFHEDNQGCIACAENDTMHDRMKHVDVKYHRIRDFIKIGQARMLYVPTNAEIGDVFTKNLDKIKFYLFRGTLLYATQTEPLT